MFSYLGSKSKLGPLYPKPRHGRIIEPFAGSARYSLLYPYNDVTLYDANPVVVDVWKYLIAAKKKDILALPDIESKVSLDTITGLSDAERALIGFHLCRGKAKPRKVGHGQNSWNKDKLRIAELVDSVKHWRAFNVDVLKTPIENPTGLATWFIDSPYEIMQEGGSSDRYPYGDGIDRIKLAEFIRTRKGFVIACEGEGADYLPFEFLTETNANTNGNAAKRSREYVYVQNNFVQINFTGAKITMTPNDAGSATGFAEATTTETEHNAANGHEPVVHDVAKRDEINDLGFNSQQTADGWVAHETLGDDDAEAIGPFETIGELLTAVRQHVVENGVVVDAEYVEEEAIEDPIVTQLESGSFTAYRPSAPHIVGAGLSAEEALYDLSVATAEAKVDAAGDMDEIERVIEGGRLEVGSTDIVEVDEDEADEDEADDGNFEVTETAKGPRLPGVTEIGNKELTAAVLKYHSFKMERVEASRKEVSSRDEMKAIAAKHEDLFVPDPENTGCVIYNASGIICRKRITHEEKFETEASDSFDTEPAKKKKR